MVVGLAVLGGLFAADCAPPVVAVGDARPQVTDGWTVTPSFKYDALCFVNVLTGDPYYLTYYEEEYRRIEPRITPDVRRALDELRRVIKTEGGGIISATLTLYFSVVEDSTLAQMSARLDDLDPMRRELEATPYFSTQSWDRFASVTDQLQVVLEFLSAIGYDADWNARHRPALERRADELAAALPDWSLLEELGRFTGAPAPAGPIEILVLHFNQPHGIRITGTRFLTYSGWPPRIVLNDAIHEMLHPPYDLSSDPALRAAIEGLRADEFVLDHLENHDPSLGYNTLEGLIEEDVVQALEQLLAERAGIADDPADRWRDSDERIHVFAAALYHVLRRDGFRPGEETIAERLSHELTEGALRPGHVRGAHDEFYGIR
jgi:hypothetical protein